ncbi:triose-phosphate isomerase family protein [Microbacterium sp. SORGH_AS_0888]|uniref:triose-phosphate isomerase family protein n=1 Tax=Microbacterium sp. SORGH_AS_0888 TaxID=3041791 RepID=UPI00277D8991|nr:triose-phosphate isomerase family protein [Microbacterium sp. SORGH_AS_0888]MDQ1130053.1 triosephosphate isomerase [Microbacterium sp. SORGH_AS_0888]
MSTPATTHDRAEDGGRAPIVLGVSLKLYLDVPTTTTWARRVATVVRSHPAVRDGAVRLFVMPSLPALPAVRDALAATDVRVGAQDIHWEDRGPFTGAVSGADLREVGCELVEVGHAERRLVFGEGEEITRRKFAAAVRNGLTPVLCIGEAAPGSPAAAADECARQLTDVLAGIGTLDCPRLVVAYEPVWAIGMPTPATAEHVADVVARLRSVLADDPRVHESSVIYGGSAQRGTLRDLGSAVDGLFLGRFAHDPAELARILDEAHALRKA